MAHDVQNISCVHCKKSFRAPVMSPRTKHAGYKCPHCRLYMPLARAADEHVETAA